MLNMYKLGSIGGSSRETSLNPDIFGQSTRLSKYYMIDRTQKNKTSKFTDHCRQEDTSRGRLTDGRTDGGTRSKYVTTQDLPPALHG